MKTPTIEITITGPQGCGKTQLLHHLEDLLQKHPFRAARREASQLRMRTHPLGDKPVVIEPPAPATVPLGENVTRSGLRARVISNDYQQDGNSVVALVQIVQGSRAEKLHYYRSDGTHPRNRDLDLVGFEHHEVKTPEDIELSELERLRRWKAEAIASMPDYPAIGEEMGLTIGDDVPSNILPYIRTLKAKLEKAKQALQ